MMIVIQHHSLKCLFRTRIRIPGFVTFFRTKTYLRNVSMFSLPFTGISIIDIGTNSGIWHIELPLFLVVFLVALNSASMACCLVSSERFRAKFIYFIGLFLLTCFLSNVQHFSCDTSNLSGLASFFSCLKFTGPKYILVNLFYVTIGFLFAIYIFVEFKSLADFREATRWFMAGALFLALVGVWEFVFYLAGLSFPYHITNSAYTFYVNSASVFPRMHSELGVMRISAGSSEPSIYSQPILFALIYFYTFLMFNMTVYGKYIDRIAIVVLLFSYIHAASTSAYLAGAAVFILHLLFFIRFNIGDLGGVKFIRLLVAAMVVSVIFHLNMILSFLDRLVINKIHTDSGVERLGSVGGALKLYASGNYFYGQGFGGVNSFDFAGKVLSNTGILGLALMFGLIVILLRELWRGVWTGNDKAFVGVSYSVFMIFISAIFLYQLSGWSYQYMYTYLPFGLAMALARGRDGLRF